MFLVAKKRVLDKEIAGESDDEERIDLFMEYYRPSELTEFDNLYQKIMPTSTKLVFLQCLQNLLHLMKESLCEMCPNTEFFWSVFSRIRTEYREIRNISPYSVRMRENTVQEKLRIWKNALMGFHRKSNSS